jgi:hypothetical protein
MGSLASTDICGMPPLPWRPTSIGSRSSINGRAEGGRQSDRVRETADKTSTETAYYLLKPTSPAGTAAMQSCG